MSVQNRSRTPRWGWRLAFAAWAWLAMGAAPAGALTIPLDVELDTGGAGRFGSVTVAPNGPSLDFGVVVGADLGPRADLHAFYLNLVPDGAQVFTNLRITASNAPWTPYTLAFPAGPVFGGAGAAFDVRVGFGSGAGRKGNGVLQFALFTLSADQPLGLDNLWQLSFPNKAGPVHVAAHVQGTSWPRGANSILVGGAALPVVAVPEPTPAVLVAVGLVALAGGRRWRVARRYFRGRLP